MSLTSYLSLKQTEHWYKKVLFLLYEELRRKKQLPLNSRISLEFFYKPQHLSPHVQLQRYSDVLFYS